MLSVRSNSLLCDYLGCARSEEEERAKRKGDRSKCRFVSKQVAFTRPGRLQLWSARQIREMIQAAANTMYHAWGHKACPLAVNPCAALPSGDTYVAKLTSACSCFACARCEPRERDISLRLSLPMCERQSAIKFRS